MASFIRRKRALLAKILVCIPILYLVSVFVFTANSDRTLPFPDSDGKRHIEKRDQVDSVDRLPGRDRNLHVVELKPQTESPQKADLSLQDNKQQVQPQDVNIDHGEHKIGKVDMKVENRNKPDLQNIQSVVKTTRDPNAPGEYV